MARKRSRIYTRNNRFWGDFRALGGKREPLVPPGEKVATTDRDLAEVLAAKRIKQLAQTGRNRLLLGIEAPAHLAEYADRHLVLKAKSGKVTRAHVVELETRLQRAVDFFGASRDLGSIRVQDIQAYVESLGKRPNHMGGTLGPGTVRHHLNALSNLYKRAQSELRVPPGFNPVAAMMDKPRGQPGEAAWLEVHEAALLLEAARRYRPRGKHHDPLPFMYPLIATYLLTGGRKREVLGLEVGDISFDRRRVTFRVHPHRRLKTKHAVRNLPLWPQLTDILQEYIIGGDAPLGDGLLFPSPRTGEMIRKFRKPLDAIAERAGWKAGEIRSRMFRHTYCAARLQTGEKRVTTLEDGRERVEWIPVSTYTVAKEMGHGGTGLVEHIYGHLSDNPHRSEVVEYRVENHRDVLGDRLTALTDSSDLPDS